MQTLQTSKFSPRCISSWIVTQGSRAISEEQHKSLSGAMRGIGMTDKLLRDGAPNVMRSKHVGDAREYNVDRKDEQYASNCVCTIDI